LCGICSKEVGLIDSEAIASVFKQNIIEKGADPDTVEVIATITGCSESCDPDLSSKTDRPFSLFNSVFQPFASNQNEATKQKMVIKTTIASEDPFADPKELQGPVTESLTDKKDLGEAREIADKEGVGVPDELPEPEQDIDVDIDSPTPTQSPTIQTPEPTQNPTQKPTNPPPRPPTPPPPTPNPTPLPTPLPTNEPTENPSSAPSTEPSSEPSDMPSVVPSNAPSSTPTFIIKVGESSLNLCLEPKSIIADAKIKTKNCNGSVKQSWTKDEEGRFFNVANSTLCLKRITGNF
jgi:hypothetical protein